MEGIVKMCCVLSTGRHTDDLSMHVHTHHAYISHRCITHTVVQPLTLDSSISESCHGI